MTRKFSSISVETTLASGISNSATSMTVATGTGAALLGGVTLAAGNVDQFTVALDVDTQNEEIVFVTAVSGDTFTIVRGRAGTSAISHTGGATVKHVLTSDDLNAFTTAISPVTNVQFAGSSSGSTTVQAAATASGTLTLPAATDTLVGKTTTDILSNKTLSSPVVTGTVTAGGGVGTNGQVLTSTGTGVSWSNASSGTVTSVTAGTGLSGGTITGSGTIAIDSTVATLTGTQTLTNKTIDYNSNTITNLPTGGQTLLSTTTLSGSSTTISSISSAYNELHIYLYEVTNSVATYINFSLPAGTNVNYLTSWMAQSTSSSPSGKGDTFNGAGFPISLVSNTKATTNVNNFVIKISNYGGSTTGFAGKYAPFTYEGFYDQSASSAHILLHGAGTIDTGTTTINSIGFSLGSGTFTGGTVKIYGVK